MICVSLDQKFFQCLNFKKNCGKSEVGRLEIMKGKECFISGFEFHLKEIVLSEV